MAISVNKSGVRVEPPHIRLSGFSVDSSTGVYSHNTHDIVTQDEVISGTTVRKREVLIFRDSVTVTLIPDSNHNIQSYNTSGTYIGPAGKDNEGTFNLRSETFYTVNGKNPRKTASNLYTGSFTVRRNLAGTDNVILKARTYVNGLESEVRTVEFRIIKNKDNQRSV